MISFDADPDEVEAVARIIYEQWLRRWWEPKKWSKYKYKGRPRLIAYLALATIEKVRAVKRDPSTGSSGPPSP